MDSLSSHALVTGGGGFLGRYIVDQLIDRGIRVTTFSRGSYPELEAYFIKLHETRPYKTCRDGWE